jgi:hypothetical protein
MVFKYISKSKNNKKALELSQVDPMEIEADANPMGKLDSDHSSGCGQYRC